MVNLSFLIGQFEFTDYEITVFQKNVGICQIAQTNIYTIIHINCAITAIKPLPLYPSRTLSTMGLAASL